VWYKRFNAVFSVQNGTDVSCQPISSTKNKIMFGLSDGDAFSTKRVEELNTKRISTNFIKWCTIREYINLKRDVSVSFLMKMPKSY
jgi:hypothetical protein